MCENNVHQIPLRETPEDGLSQRIPQRWFSVIEGMDYYRLSRSSLMKLGEAAGGIRHFGRRVMIDRLALDQYLDNQK
jgi:hypothetical protein